MKTSTLIVMTTLLQAATVSCQTNQEDVPVLKGPYLGQRPPGVTPEIFAPGIVSSPGATEYSGTFSPNGDEYYFYRFSKGLPAKILFSKVVDGKWTVPQPAAFAEGYPSFEPHITFDNKSIYFGWEHPLPDGELGDPNVPGMWVSNRKADGWSAPTYAGQGMFVSSSRDGHIYTTDMSSRNVDGKTYLAQTVVKNNRFTSYEKLAIQSHLGNQAHPCVAPDGSYLLFDVGGGNHLFVCFKQPDGTWGEAIDLVNHGFDPKAGGAYVTPDGKYLFFHLRGDLWWVDISVIEKLRSTAGK